MRLKDEAWRLDLAAYARTVAIRTAYADVDSFQHLNNVALARFFEEGRADVNMAVFGVDAVVRPSGGVQLLFASVAIEYLSQGEYPGEVTVGTAVSKVGRSSFNQAGAIFQDGRCLALCEAVTVYASGGRGEALPEPARKALEALQAKG